MATPSHAVFLSYASEDAEAAQRIAEALRAAGIEVWFDRSALRGGEEWDRKIREEIRDCALFIPVISVNTHARDEGYFRLEWKLAIDRSHLMAPDKAFLLPVVIDDTPQADRRIPDRFRELQWTRVPAGDSSPAFIDRVTRLLTADSEAPPVSRRVTSKASALPPTPGAGPSGWRWPHLVVAAVAVAVVAGYLAYQRPWTSRQAVSQSTPITSQTAFSPPPHSVAVLPFVNMSGDTGQEYFSDGLTEELLDLLSQVPDLRVPARTSSFYFKGRSDDITTIAQKLRVAHLLEGSVRRSGNRIRVTAQLIRADNGYHLWSRTYDRDDKDIFAVQDEIANAVVSALKVQLLSAQSLASRHHTDNTEAYTAYLLGNQLRSHDTPDSNRQALKAYQRAVSLDPGYGPAYAGIADAEWRIADMVTGEPAAYQRSLEAAEHAIALAPDLTDGYWARGALRMDYYYDWLNAEKDFKKALELDPNDVRVLREYGDLLATLGRTPEALATMRKSLVLDPLAARAWRQLALLQLDLGQLAEAKQSARYLENVQSDGWMIRGIVGMIALVEGRAEDALAEFNKADSGNFKLIGGAMAEYTLGQTAASQTALEQLIRTRSVTNAYQIANVYAWRGERDAAFAWLERAYRQHDGAMGYLPHDRFFAPLRDDSRFRALLKKLNLT